MDHSFRQKEDEMAGRYTYRLYTDDGGRINNDERRYNTKHLATMAGNRVAEIMTNGGRYKVHARIYQLTERRVA